MFRKQDLGIFGATIVLSLLGLFTLISTNIGLDGGIDLGGIVAKQVVFILVGYLAYFLVAKFDYTYLKHLQIIGVLYIGTIVLLVVTLLWGPVINNVQRWIIVGGVQVQASEIAKLVVIITTASIMSMKYKYNEWLLAIVSFVLVIPISALIYQQPHGAMAVIMFALWFLITFTFLDNQLRNVFLLVIVGSMGIGLISIASGFPIIGALLVIAAIVTFVMGFYSRDHWRKLFVMALALGLIVGAIGTVSWKSDRILKPYQRDRIEVFLNSESVDPDDAFNVNQAKIAIGSGGIIGKGFGYGTQSRLQYLPEHQTDFIFATYAEQFGLLGSLFMLGVYGYLVARILWLGANIHDDMFGAVLATGLGVKILLEVFINVGTNTGAIPATGIPLPLMSAGGSITVMTFVTLGLVQSIIIHRRNEPTIGNLIDNEDLIL